MSNWEAFAWIGGFSSAPNTKKAAELTARSPVTAKQIDVKKLKLLWISCGDKDGLLRISQGFHDDLVTLGIPHLWTVYPAGRHDFAVWNMDLYHFAPLLFR
ncbi:MAG: hypothetical protein QM811_15510 [Pirellulales bacterium]